jgi:NADP-dependent 3-hydroxy acid dehydrogenase YdfG
MPCTTVLVADWLQQIRDKSLKGKFKGKVIDITGTTAGTGLETARALSTTGATLILTARDLKKAETSLSENPGNYSSL